MKKLIALGTSILLTLPAIQAEEVFQYNKISESSKKALTLTIAGTVSAASSFYMADRSIQSKVYFTLMEALYKVTSNQRTAMHVIDFGLMAGVITSGLGAGTGIFTLGSDLTQAKFLDIDRESFIKEFNLLRLASMSILATGKAPTDVASQKVISTFKCDSCENVDEQAQRFATVFHEISKEARLLAMSTDLIENDLNKTLEKQDLNEKFKEILGEDFTVENVAVATSLYAMALVDAIDESKE